MSRIRLPLLLTLVIFCFALPAFAQDALPLTQTFTSSDGLVSFQYPDGWQTHILASTDGTSALDVTLANTDSAVDKDAFFAFSHLDSGEVALQFFVGSPAAIIGPLAGIEDTDDPVKFLQSYTDEFKHFYKKFSGDVNAVTAYDLPAARIDFNDDKRGEGFLTAIHLKDGILGVISVSAALGELSDWEATAHGIIASLSYSESAEPVAETNTALDLTQHYVSSDQLASFSYPADWAIDVSNSDAESLDIDIASSPRVLHLDPVNPPTTRFAPGEVRINIATGKKSDIAKQAGLPADTSISDILTKLLKQVNSDNAQFDPVEQTTVGDYPAGRATFTAPGYAEGFLMLIDFGGGVIGAVGVYAAPRELSRWEATVLDIAASLTYGSAAEVTPEATAEGSTDAALALPETFKNDDGTVTFDYPAGWLIDVNPGASIFFATLASSQSVSNRTINSQLVLAPGEVIIQLWVIGEDDLLRASGLKSGSSLVEILDAIYQSRPLAQGVTLDKAVEVSIGSLPGAQVHLTQGNNSEVLVSLAHYGDGVYILTPLLTAPGEVSTWETTAHNITASITYNSTP